MAATAQVTNVVIDLLTGSGITLSLLNIAEAFQLFKSHKSTLFKAIILSNLGVVGSLATFLPVIHDPSVISFGYLAFHILVWWFLYNASYNFILLSRLKLFSLNNPTIKKIMALSLCHITFWIIVCGYFFFTAYVSQDPEDLRRYSIIEPVQISSIFVFEMALTGFYLFKTYKNMELLKKSYSSAAVWKLIINLSLIVILDIATVLSQLFYSNHFQIMFKYWGYSVKIYLQFHALKNFKKINTLNSDQTAKMKSVGSDSHAKSMA
ncbi:hypothetical protein BKA69DRAFT_1044909 [Paraphysoderma sedebokerense]|nr:hypothetical protein BKA69DRAFT_1044909 [Paraphysoderma sedebokerense]